MNETIMWAERYKKYLEALKKSKQISKQNKKQEFEERRKNILYCGKHYTIHK